MTTSPATPADGLRRVLVVTAHPDDADFGSAGTIASWTAAGVDVTYCVCTSGDAGAGETPREEVPRLRQAEQHAAAEAVGVTGVHFLGYRDGQVTVTLALRRDITKMIRTLRPQVVLTHSPEINWSHIAVSHPDHRAVGEATLAAVYPDARNAFAHPALLEQHGLQPWTVGQLWMTETPEERINHAVDITDYLEAKVAALRAHHSQTSHFDDLEGALRTHLGRNAQRHGFPPGRLAESFQVVDTA
jgi:LmbE family N-acetylglucosaminyl deacetylase